MEAWGLYIQSAGYFFCLPPYDTSPKMLWLTTAGLFLTMMWAGRGIWLMALQELESAMVTGCLSYVGIHSPGGKAMGSSQDGLRTPR